MPSNLINSLYDKLLSRLGLAMLALALLVNLGALLAVYKGVDILAESRRQAIQARGAVIELVTIQSLLFEAESAQRGYLYTGNISYLAGMIENEPRIVGRLTRLRDIVGDSPAQQMLVDQIRKIATEKLAEMNKSIAIKQMGQDDAVRTLVMTDQGKKLMDELETEISQAMSQQEQIRAGFMERTEDIELAIRWGFAAILFVNALLILAGAMTIMRDIERDRAELVRMDERAMVLASEVAQRAEELRALSAHLLRVQEEERHTIARELHDELGGTLSAVKMDILMGRDAAAKRNDEKAVARLQRAITSVDSSVQFTRRLIEDLRPTLLDNLGFEAALRSMTEQFSERCTVTCDIELPEGELNLTSGQSTALYRICQEALTNVMKYAQAKRVTIKLTSDGSHWTLLLADDGVGLDSTNRNRSISHGLLGMRERIVALDGTFDIRGPAGAGTTLTATLPIRASEVAAA
ncbi:MAG: CHASE3 domain-containing protein [Burkholderiales bacterium]|nr:CHASE3 domain-containing protein [Burkholderiales bacterium]